MVFDMVGTTIRDRGDVPAALSEALEASGLSADPATIRTFRGASKHEVLRRLIAEQRPSLGAPDREGLVTDAYRRFRNSLAERLRTGGALALPQAVEAFERLQPARVLVAVHSGFDRTTVDLVLAAAGWPDHLVDTVVCGDDVPAGRPAPYMIFRCMERTGVTDVRAVAVVGDTQLDLEAGANAGAAYRIGVLTGAHDRETLELAPYTQIVESVRDVPALWGW